MTDKEKTEQFIQQLAEILRNNSFSFQMKAVKKPKGIRIIYEVTQEEMDELIKNRR